MNEFVNLAILDASMPSTMIAVSTQVTKFFAHRSIRL